MGQALYRVLHDERLLKTASFIKWANANFGLTRSTAYEYIRAYRIVEMIRAQDKALPVPSTLSHFRVFNKTKLKDGGREVCRLWRMILRETPPDSHNRLTAKEVLAKGRQILARERSRRRTSVDLDSEAGNGFEVEVIDSAALSSEETKVRRRPVREHARRATGYLQRLASDSLSDDEDEEEVEEQMDDSYTTPAFAVAGGLHERPRRRARPAEFDLERRESIAQPPPAKKRAANTDSDRSGQPPALIKIPERVGVLTVPMLASLSKQLVRGGRFDMCVAPPSTGDEEVAVDSPIVLDHDACHRTWSGRVWANLSGPYFADPSEAGRFAEALATKFDSGEFSEGVFLVNLAFGQSWFNTLLEYPHCFLKQPVATLLPPATADGVDEIHHYCCMAVYMGNDVDQFVEHFASLGTIPGVNSWCNYTDYSV